ncbi:MAG TPA: ADP-ribosylation factor-like protein [Kofleriaceae bacterium]|jgi:signal recognition particle receptor subunit beta
MPIVDRRTNSVVLRIVYDGPPEAGKTTNLRMLCDRLSRSRRGVIDSPGGHDRTRFFDWLDVTGGWVGDHRVRCQLVTVPGQIQLARRRRHILDSADVVVFVADSRASAAPETSAALRSLARGLSDRADVPLVLQANKQDLPDARSPGDLHAALGLAARIPTVAAHASGGTGVLETFLLAVRLAVDHVRALLVAGELGDGDATGAAELLRALEADAPAAFEALDAIAQTAAAVPAGSVDAAAELLARLRSEAPTRPIRMTQWSPPRGMAAVVAADATPAPVWDAPAVPEAVPELVISRVTTSTSMKPLTPPPANPAQFPVTDDDTTWDLPAVPPSALVRAARHRERSAPIVLEAAYDASAPSLIDAGYEPSAPIVIDAAYEPSAPIASDPHHDPHLIVADKPVNGATRPVPLGLPPPPDPLPFPLPPVDLPVGMVWPGVGGRAALAALTAPVRVAEQLAPWAPVTAIELTCGDGWSAHTSPDLVFADIDHGRPALLAAAQWQTKLGHLTPPGRTYALAPEGTGVRLWVVTPAYRTVWAAIEDAFACGDRKTVARLANAGLDAVDQLRARGVPISDLDHIAVDEPARLLATPWTAQRDRLTAQLQRLFSAAVL